MAISLVASTRGVAVLPVSAENFLKWSVISRPLKGEAPTIDLVVGYHKANTSPILRTFLSRIDDLTARISSKARRMIGPGSAAAPYGSYGGRIRYNNTICPVSGCCGGILAKRTNFGIPNEINAVRFPCRGDLHH